MKAFKLLHVRKNGTLGSLFINRKAILPIGKWLKAEVYPTKGFAFRPKWHSTVKPYAPHLSINDRVWCEVEIKNISEFIRPEEQGGKWYLSEFLKIVRLI